MTVHCVGRMYFALIIIQAAIRRHALATGASISTTGAVNLNFYAFERSGGFYLYGLAFKCAVGNQAVKASDGWRAAQGFIDDSCDFGSCATTGTLAHR